MSNVYESSYAEQASPIRLRTVIRDVIIVMALTFLSGFVIGFSISFAHLNVDQAKFMMMISISNIVFSIVGYFISGCLTPQARWTHLTYVAIGVWLASLCNLAFGVTVVQWLLGLPVSFVAMAVGGSMSAIIVRAPRI
ncbi:MAG: hypothetical protein JO218_12810 [Burkholderiales bacterium]|nr:hypothetical protein [Burkholderiales bacterium]